MGTDIRVCAPDHGAPTNPVSGLTVRTILEAGGYRQVRIDCTATDSGWHTLGATLYAWVSEGSGAIAAGPDAEQTAIESGTFLRIPSDTPVRYEAASRLVLLGVLAGTEDWLTPSEPPATATEGPVAVSPDGLVTAMETPQLTRKTPFPDDPTVALLRVRAAGGAAAGWHHHGDNVYFGYAVDGPSETEYGPEGEQVARIERGECFHVPPGLVHRDTNPTDQAHAGIIWLCGGEPWVVNVAGPE